MQVVASDQDKGYNGQVRYSVVQQPNQIGTKFIVDEITGEVRTNKVSMFSFVIIPVFLNMFMSDYKILIILYNII